MCGDGLIGDVVRRRGLRAARERRLSAARTVEQQVAVTHTRDEVQLLYEWNTESVLFMVEVVLGVLGPMALLTMKKVRGNPLGQFLSAMLVVLGFVMNRLNVSTTGMEASLKAGYFPSWMEMAVTAGIVVLGFVLFAAAVKHLPVFTEEAEGVSAPVVRDGTSIGNEVRAAAGQR